LEKQKRKAKSSQRKIFVPNILVVGCEANHHQPRQLVRQAKLGASYKVRQSQ